MLSTVCPPIWVRDFVFLLLYVYPAFQRLCEMIRSDNCVLRCSCPARNASQVTQTPRPHRFSPILTPTFSLWVLNPFLCSAQSMLWPQLAPPTSLFHFCSFCTIYSNQETKNNRIESWSVNRLWRNTSSPQQPPSRLSMGLLFSCRQAPGAGRTLMHQVYNQISSFTDQYASGA